jgi:hypothetical protein
MQLSLIPSSIFSKGELFASCAFQEFCRTGVSRRYCVTKPDAGGHET